MCLCMSACEHQECEMYVTAVFSETDQIKCKWVVLCRLASRTIMVTQKTVLNVRWRVSMIRCLQIHFHNSFRAALIMTIGLFISINGHQFRSNVGFVIDQETDNNDNKIKSHLADNCTKSKWFLVLNGCNHNDLCFSFIDLWFGFLLD